MIHHRTEPMSAADRGYAFGSTYPDEIVNNIDFYRRLFFKLGGISEHEIVDLGAEALIATRSWAPDLADEIEAVAAGARLKAELLGALNARTEILGRCRTAARECSVAVVLGPQDTNPVAIQTWDWHDAVEQGWLVWTIEHPTGRTVHTLTEYGIVGKIGVCSRGLGLLLNILRHADDGEELGTPVHIIARRVLDEADDVNTALDRKSTRLNSSHRL